MDYNHAQMEYRERCKDRIKRQLFITGQSTTDEKLEEIIESGNVDVFTQVSLIHFRPVKITMRPCGFFRAALGHADTC